MAVWCGMLPWRATASRPIPSRKDAERLLEIPSSRACTRAYRMFMRRCPQFVLQTTHGYDVTWRCAASSITAEFLNPDSSRQSQPPALFRTTNAGRTWQPEYVPVPCNLVADGGLAAISGMTWFGQKGFMDVSFASDGLPYQRWGLYATTDGGARWSLHLVNGVRNNDGDQRVQVTIDTCSPQNLWEVVTRFEGPPGQADVAKSSQLYHAGAITSRWTFVARTPVPFSTVQFVTPQLGFALGINGALYDTANGGHSWSHIAAVQTNS